MQLTSQAEWAAYLAPCTYIDFTHPDVWRKAHALTAGCTDDRERIARCFAFVRDEIKHSWDYRLNPVTCKASDVLQHGTGYCYAKSHLLAALLRANGIATGLCYQKLSLSGATPPFCLHGLNAVWLVDEQAAGQWYRLDPRGNKPGVDAQFCPPHERLAFPITHPGEADLPGVWAAPWPAVTRVLAQHPSVEAVFAHLAEMV